MKNWIIATILFAPNSAFATGMYQCEAIAAEDWLTEAQLTEKVEADGWAVSRMKKDGGCWEVYGATPDGKRVEAYFHPGTGEVLLINQRGTILFKKDE